MFTLLFCLLVHKSLIIVGEVGYMNQTMSFSLVKDQIISTDTWNNLISYNLATF